MKRAERPRETEWSDRVVGQWDSVVWLSDRDHEVRVPHDLRARVGDYPGSTRWLLYVGG